MTPTSLAAAITLLLAACAAPPTPQSRDAAPLQATKHERAFPPPRGELAVSAEGMTLEQLLSQLSARSGVNFAFDAQVREALAATKLNLTQSLVLRPDEAYAWSESQLVSSGLVLSFDPNVTPTTLRVARSGSQQLSAVPLGVEELEFARQHPALLVQFTLTLPHTDVRTLPSTLRPLMDPNVSALLPVGNTQTIVVQGAGQHAAHVVDLLRNVDEQARLALGGQDPRRPAAPVQAASR